MNKTQTSPLPSVGKRTSKGKRVILNTVKMSLGHYDSMKEVIVLVTKALVK